MQTISCFFEAKDQDFMNSLEGMSHRFTLKIKVCAAESSRHLGKTLFSHVVWWNTNARHLHFVDWDWSLVPSDKIHGGSWGIRSGRTKYSFPVPSYFVSRHGIEYYLCTVYIRKTWKYFFNFFNLLQVQKVQFQKSRGYLRKDKCATWWYFFFTCSSKSYFFHTFFLLVIAF